MEVDTTYLAIRTKNNQNIFEYENLLLLKPPQITGNNIKHCVTEKNKNNNFIKLIRNISR